MFFGKKTVRQLQLEIQRRASLARWEMAPQFVQDEDGYWRAAWTINLVAWVKTMTCPSYSEAEQSIYLTVGRIFGVDYTKGV